MSGVGWWNGWSAEVIGCFCPGKGSISGTLESSAASAACIWFGGGKCRSVLFCFLFLITWLILFFNWTPLLDYFLTDMARRYFDLEEKYSQGQTELAQVSASPNDASTLSSTLRAQLDSEKVTSESWLCLLCSYCLLDVWRNWFLFARGKARPCHFSWQPWQAIPRRQQFVDHLGEESSLHQGGVR